MEPPILQHYALGPRSLEQLEAGVFLPNLGRYRIRSILFEGVGPWIRTEVAQDGTEGLLSLTVKNGAGGQVWGAEARAGIPSPLWGGGVAMFWAGCPAGVAPHQGELLGYTLGCQSPLPDWLVIDLGWSVEVKLYAGALEVNEEPNEFLEGVNCTGINMLVEILPLVRTLRVPDLGV